MAIKREWTELEKQSLLKHILEYKKKGITIKRAAQKFSEKYPYITPGQARVYYYKLINETENFRKKYPQKVWTHEDNETLFSFMATNKDKKKMEIFDLLSEKLGRHPKAIASHYYSVKSDSLKFNSNYYFNLLGGFASQNFNNLFAKINKIQEVYEKAVEIESILCREKIIAELNKELEEARVKIEMLEQKIMAS